MAKRKHLELARGYAGGLPSGTSARFGGFEIVKEYLHIHPIFKSIQVGTSKSCYDMDSVLSSCPRRQRSKQRNQTEKKIAAKNARNRERNIAEESKNECHIITYQRRPQNVRGKQEADTSDTEVILNQPICYGRRQSRRLHHSIDNVRNLGKLDDRKFEIYMENVWRGFTEEKKNAIAYIDSLWFSLYSKGSLKEKVLSWIKKKDIFSKKYVFVPVVQWSHWFLLIFCNFDENQQSETENRCILLLDSLGKANSEQLAPEIRRFVFDIFKTEKRPENEFSIGKIPLLIPKVPQQKNGEECGFFVLYYIKQFLESAPEKFTFPIGYPHFMKEDWFTPEDVESFVETLDAMNKTSDCSLILS